MVLDLSNSDVVNTAVTCDTEDSDLGEEKSNKKKFYVLSFGIN